MSVSGSPKRAVDAARGNAIANTAGDGRGPVQGYVRARYLRAALLAAMTAGTA